ncbi:MAG: TerD family protein [Alphaproteobacteria bacterium]|nr:TerD family protein [Alphaproteobacteria bacterium]MCK5518097.1 TerD family protein [Alphaproteobacteria bacterium]MCK5555596.1 TerD family protein [Alphaproteobacteria bacterium]MCK5658494.1 TerD family protein [Alphaproteobacteria bacterium]
MQKGQEVNLMEIDPGLHRVVVGLGWDVPGQNHGFPVDLDASAFLLNRENCVRHDTDFIFYNNLETEECAIKHLGDNTTGEGEGDDEEIEINLDALPFDVEKIAFSVTIHNSDERQQNFGIVSGAFIRIVNLDTGVELARFDLSEDASDENGFIFGELSRDGQGWKFKAMGQGSTGGLYKISCDYNVNVAAP